MNTRLVRNILRNGISKSLKRRRKIITLSAVGLIDFSIISLYQVGVIKKLPDLPGKIFDSNKVNASEDAYMMGVPDGPVSAGLYTLNMILAAYGGGEKAGRPMWSDILLSGVALANAGGAVYYLKNMITKQKKACPYCILGAGLNFAIVPYAFQELKSSLQTSD